VERVFSEDSTKEFRRLVASSVDRIERFYVRNLPLSKEMAKNLQSCGIAESTQSLIGV